MFSPKEILLINPWIYDFTAYDFWLKPLGLLYIAAVLRDHVDCRLRFIDCLDRCHPGLTVRPTIKPDGRGPFPKEAAAKPAVLKDIPRRYSRYGIPIPLFLEELERCPLPDVVLLTSGMTYWYPGVQQAVELVRRKWGRIPIILGGIYATLAPEHARRESGADKIIEGPGENKILPLLKDILGDGWVRPREFSGFEAMPSPAFDLLRDKEALPLLTSRGCPFSCSFCATPHLHPHFEQRPPQSVVKEVETAIHLWGTTNLAFYDDALLLRKESHIIPFLEGVVAKNLRVSFHTPNGLHVREIDDSLARLFRRAGVRSLYLSQETFDDALLERSCPKVSPGDLEKAIDSLEGAGYNRPDINVYLIVGLPGQSFSVVRESIRRVRQIGARPRLAFFSPVPGTAEFQRLVDKGSFREDTDPLLHNKLTFAYLWGDIGSEDFAALRELISGSLHLTGDMLS
jgi:hypothetical protein